MVLPTLLIFSSEGYVRTVCSLVMPIADGILHMALELLTVTDLRLAKGRLFISKSTTLKKPLKFCSPVGKPPGFVGALNFATLPQ